MIAGRFTWPLVAAVALHLSVLLSVAFSIHAPAALKVSIPAATAEWEIDVVSSDPQVARETSTKAPIQPTSIVPEGSTAPPTSAQQSTASTAPAITSPEAAEHTAPTAEGATYSAHSTPAEASQEGNPEVAPRLSLSDMGLDGPSVFFLPKVETPLSDTSRAERSVMRSMAQAVLDHDQEVAASRHGVLSRTIADAAYAHVPPRSTARLVALLDKNGQIIDISVSQVSRGYKLWQAVAKRALAKLAGRRLQTGINHSVEVILEATSKILLPSGGAPGPGVSLLGLVLKKKRYKESPEIALLKPKLELKMVEVPDPSGSGGMIKIPKLQAGVSLLDLPLDPVDIAANERQVVHTRVIRQRAL